MWDVKSRVECFDEINIFFLILGVVLFLPFALPWMVIEKIKKRLFNNMTQKNAQKIIGAPDDVSLDMTKVEKEFNKTKYISLDEGLRNTIEWQKALYASIK